MEAPSIEALHGCRRLSFPEGVVERADSDGGDLLGGLDLLEDCHQLLGEVVQRSEHVGLDHAGAGDVALLDLGGLQVDGDLVVVARSGEHEVDGVEMAVHLGRVALDLDVVSPNRLLVQDPDQVLVLVDEVDNLLAVERVLRHLNAFLTRFGRESHVLNIL